MSDKYFTVTVKLSENDIKQYLLEYINEEDIKNTNLQSEATEIINGILSDHFSDYYCLDCNSIIVGDL